MQIEKHSDNAASAFGVKSERFHRSEEKGTSQTRHLVSPQRIEYEVGRRIRERTGISQNYLSTMERGKVEIGAEILLRIGQEFAKSVEWLLTG